MCVLPITSDDLSHRRRLILLEVTVLKLKVYYHGVLRYTIVAYMEKAQVLRDQGFYVVVKPAA